MRKNGIGLKLFIITTVFFIAFIGATMLIQAMFFEKFYVARKMDILQKNINDFKKDYILKAVNINEMLKNMYKFAYTNNAELAIVDKSDNFRLMTSSVQNGDDPGKDEILQSAILQWTRNTGDYQAQLNSGKNITYTIKHPIYNTNNIVVISPIVSGNTVSSVLIAVSSLQPIGEASYIIKEFYIYVFAAAILLILVLSLVYSNMISKPLVKLNNAASKMTELDFSTKCTIESTDEIGSLASTLNFLSDKLDTTLTELKDANEKLKEDIEKERSLEKMRKEFVAGVSHELKTPISLIEGYAEGLKDNIAQGEDRDYYLNVIIDEANKMGALVKDMLDLSRLDSGNLKLDKNEFFITELVLYILKRFSNSISNKGIRLHLDFTEDEITVYADKFRIEQVVTNFISNAIRHTPENGSITVNIKVYDNKAILEVENQGDHIPDDELIKIWEKFYRVEKSRNRELGGTGLGLAISKNILELHKSDYGAENTEVGVKFYFTLPLCSIDD